VVQQIAIVGGGPAGATAAETLMAGAGSQARRSSAFQVTIFEEKAGWEKPCGGGLPAKAIRRYPFLMEGCRPFAQAREAELVADNGEAVRFCLRAPLLVYSRAVLNDLLLSRAEAAGACIVQDHIRELHHGPRGWKLQGGKSAYRADFLILAAGARSSLRRLLAPPLAAADFMLTYGYYSPSADPVLRVQFFKNFEGYAWAFPRPDHLSLGICGKCGEAGMAELRERLHDFMRRFHYSPGPARIFSHLLPALDTKSWRQLHLVGEQWAIAGDAAGLVDPITGEGIYYAMRSGELLAESLLPSTELREAERSRSLEESPECYPERVWREFGSRLAMAARLAPRFYHGDFLGEPSTTRLVEFCSRSPAFMDVLQNLLEGSQSYVRLTGRLYWTFARSVVQIAAHSVKKKFFRFRSAIMDGVPDSSRRGA
jgi:flavin-dependent dehydrogenase